MPCCVQSLKLNGGNYDRLWVPWTDLSKGATLDFTLGDSPSAWGTGAHSAPPSFDTIKP